MNTTFHPQNTPNTTVTPILRKNHFQIDSLERYWIPNNAFLSRYLDSLFLMFPTGEHLFIQAVRKYLKQIESDTLRKDAKAFIYQEAQHTLAHEAFNQHLLAQGIESKAMETFVKGVVHLQEKILPKKVYMALAAGGEHFTASMAETLIEDFDEYLEGAPQELRSLWCWHCVEEIEHKSVTFDVYQNAAKGGYGIRQLGFLISFLNLILLPQITMLHLIAKDKQLTNLSAWKKGLSALYGKKGLVRRITSKLVVYLKPGFHPKSVPVPNAYYRWQAEFSAQKNIYSATAATFPQRIEPFTKSELLE